MLGSNDPKDEVFAEAEDLPPGTTNPGGRPTIFTDVSLSVQYQMARAGRHRSASAVDLIIRDRRSPRPDGSA